MMSSGEGSCACKVHNVKCMPCPGVCKCPSGMPAGAEGLRRLWRCTQQPADLQSGDGGSVVAGGAASGVHRVPRRQQASHNAGADEAGAAC